MIIAAIGTEKCVDMRKILICLGMAAVSLTACQSSTDVLDSQQLARAAATENARQTSVQTTAGISTSNPPSEGQLIAPPIQQQDNTAIAALVPTDQQASNPNNRLSPQFQNVVEPEAVKPRTRKTFLLNGLVSAVPFIGFGLTNLQKKIPGSKLYSYLSPVEGSVAIAPAVIKEVVKAHRADPTVEVNLIGISYGANLITQIASNLNKKGIKVHYLGIIEGTTLKRIPSNVVVADNFTCTNLDCTRGKARLVNGNRVTQLENFKFRTSHIPMGNNKKMHNRIIRQIEG